LAFQNPKNDTLRHSIPYCYLLRNIVCYFISLVKDSGNDAFFQSKQNSKWYLVAFGMIGTALGDFYFGSWRGPQVENNLNTQFVLGNAIDLYSLLKYYCHCITE
jgi:hypothetical protein